MGRTFTEGQIRELIATAVAEATSPLRKRIAELEAEIARLKKNSSTSSKPPSSDIVKPPPAGRKRKRRLGGQPGHPRHDRPVFPPEEVDRVRIYERDDLGQEWEPLDEFRIVQQVDLVDDPLEVVEHRARRYRHCQTGAILTASLPPGVAEAGLIGLGLSSLIAYQKGACHMSYTTIQKFLSDVLGLSLSTGQLAKVVQKASVALGPCHAELQAALPEQGLLNVDETGHPEGGKRHWTWGFHVPGASGFTWFHIDPSRSAEVLEQFLGEAFSGVLGCDYYSAYRKFLSETNGVMQFCWAHLVRDVKFLTTLPDPVTQRYGEKLLARIKQLFRVWHSRDGTPTEHWQRRAQRARQAVVERARRPPPRKEAQNIAQRFREHEDCYFTFLRLPGVEPTNNAMERQLRFVAIDRKITQGTRGEPGRRWCERMWTVATTCVQQGRSVFHFLRQAIVAHFHDQPCPSLLPSHP
jgi:transposase